MAQATIVLEMFKSGLHVMCEDTDTDDFVKHGDGNRLMEILNEIYDITDPDARFTLTDKGKYLAKLMESGVPFEEACERTDKEYKEPMTKHD